MIDAIRELLGMAKRKNAKKKQSIAHGTGGKETTRNDTAIQPGSIYRKGGRARQLREMDE